MTVQIYIAFFISHSSASLQISKLAVTSTDYTPKSFFLQVFSIFKMYHFSRFPDKITGFFLFFNDFFLIFFFSFSFFRHARGAEEPPFFFFFYYNCAPGGISQNLSFPRPFYDNAMYTPGGFSAITPSISSASRMPVSSCSGIPVLPASCARFCGSAASVFRTISASFP